MLLWSMGRIPSTLSPSVERYGLGYIRPYHREIARRLVLGERSSQICADLGISESRMSIIVNSPLFKLEIKRLEEARDKGVADVRQQLEELSPLALEQVERTMYQAPSPTLRFKAAESILDRAGYGAISKSQIRVNSHSTVEHSNMTDGEIRRLIMERVERMVREEKEREEAEKEAEAMEVDFEDVSRPSDNYPIKVLKL